MARAKHSLVDTTGLIVSLAALEERLQNLIDSFERERDGAQSHRRELREVIAALSESVRNLNATVKRIEPVVNDYQERRAEAAGMVKLGRFLHAVGYAGSAIIGALAHRMIP